MLFNILADSRAVGLFVVFSMQPVGIHTLVCILQASVKMEKCLLRPLCCEQIKTQEELEVMQYANDVASAAHVKVKHCRISLSCLAVKPAVRYCYGAVAGAVCV